MYHEPKIHATGIPAFKNLIDFSPKGFIIAVEIDERMDECPIRNSGHKRLYPYIMVL